MFWLLFNIRERLLRMRDELLRIRDELLKMRDELLRMRDERKVLLKIRSKGNRKVTIRFEGVFFHIDSKI